MHRLYLYLRTACDNLSRGLGYIVALVVIIMFGSIFSQVICRYAFNNPINWAEELTQFLMAWMSFLGAAIAVWSWSHVGIDLLLNKLTGRTHILVALVIRCAVLPFSLFLFIAGVDFVVGSQGMVSDGMRIPMIYPRLAVPIGGASMVLFTLTHILGDLCALQDSGGRS